MSDSTPALSKKEKLQQQINQAKAQLAALEARESVNRRKLETRGAIVFSGFAVKVSPALLDEAIASLEAKERTTRETLDLNALKAFRDRGSS